MNRIVFLLPDRGNVPVGGYKVAYEYANRFAGEGYPVHIVYPAWTLNEKLSAFRVLKRFAKYLKVFFMREWSCASWFALKGEVKEHWVFTLSRFALRSDDIVFATAAQTALHLDSVRGGPARENRFYLIQHWEEWIGLDLLVSTWKANLRKIVIAPWLKEIGERYGQRCELIENGFDFEYFSLTTPIESRKPHTVAMLYHTSALKGCGDGIEALRIVKRSYQDLTCKMFSVFAKPDDLPEWIEFIPKPDRMTHNALYNESAVFLAPALAEGFALTPAEAMQCGCAVVATNIGGYTVACVDGVSALLREPKNPASLADGIIRFFEDDALRVRMAKGGNAHIRSYTWDRAFGKMLAFVRDGAIK